MEMKYYSDPYTPSGDMEQIGGIHDLYEYNQCRRGLQGLPAGTDIRRHGTIYLVEYDTSDNAKETAYEKIRRLLLNDVDALRTSSSC